MYAKTAKKKQMKRASKILVESMILGPMRIGVYVCVCVSGIKNK